MSSKKHLLNLALTGIALAVGKNSAQAVAKYKTDQKTVQCFGIQKCAGTGHCAVSKAQLDEANKKLKPRKFSELSIHACKGFNQCAAVAKNSEDLGMLEWIVKPSKKECLHEGGFVFNTKGEVE